MMQENTLQISKSIFQTVFQYLVPKLDHELEEAIEREREKIRKISIGIGSDVFELGDNWQEQGDNVHIIRCSLDGKDCTVVNVVFKDDGYMAEHDHDRLEMVFVAAGQITEIVSGRVLKEGDSMTIPANQKHGWRSDYAKLTVVWKPPYPTV